MNPFGKRVMSRSPDFERIKNLPKRAPFDGAALAREMTDALKRTDGCPGTTSTNGLCDYCLAQGMTVPVMLKPVQAQALYECMKQRGLAALMGVGVGKTLVFLMAPVVLDLHRPLGLLPASLIEKTERERLHLSRHWHVAASMQLVSYEALGRVDAATLLEVRRPDGMITDESHRVKNQNAACTKRVARYMHDFPETVFVCMTGTFFGKSLRDGAHLLRWSLGADKAPVPMKDGELDEWADAVDERVNPLQRVSPGPLLALAPPQSDDLPQLTQARRAFQHRLESTPGVVCSLNADQVNCSIYIEGQDYGVNEATEKNFETLRTLWETPDGWALSEAVDVWRHARELSLGFHYVWDPRPPDEWLAARRAWAKYVRTVLANSNSLDSEKQVALACAHGEIPDAEYRAWEAIKPSFKVNQKAVWHDESVLDLCARWLKKERGICWVEHTFFGHELSRRTGLPYFGQGGLSSKGENILDAKGPIIASIAANGTGKNLQAWSKNLVTSCPTGASVWEQLIGRTHRQGQAADEVMIDILVGCIEHVDAFERARAEAQMSADMVGQSQKILIGDIVMPSANEASSRPGHRWRKSTNTV